MKSHRDGFILLLVVALTLPAAGQSPAPATVPVDRDVLLNGEGAGQASYAEMNGYPGPKHVLELADQLELAPKQRKDIQEIYQQVTTRAKELGKAIVKIETELNSAFSAGLVTEKSVQDDTEEIGRLRARLRAVHLTAHLKMKPLLSKKQLELYRTLRAKLSR